MYDFVFSIPVHERFEVITDQIININYYNPNCAIVLHLSPVFDYNNSEMTRQEFERIADSLGNIYINPVSVRTGFADIIQAHIANFDYIKDLIDFEYFSMLSSNELFVRHGLYQSAQGYDCCVTLKPLPKNNHKSDCAITDTDLKGFLELYPSEEIKNSQIEGSYYRKELFARICNHISSFYDYKTMKVAYPREEIYFSTVLSCMLTESPQIVRKTKAFTFINWEDGLFVTVSDVRRIRYSKENIRYSVKRVDRRMDNALRLYILYTGGYFNIEKKYNNLSIYLLLKGMLDYAKPYCKLLSEKIKNFCHAKY